MRRIAGILALSMICFTGIASATPTQEEVFQSINQNVGSTVDLSKWVPYLLAILAIIILTAIYNNRRQQPGTVKRLNHSGKLLREVGRALNLKSAEVKQLKLLAQEQQVSPLTLLLCPSVLAKSLRSPNPKIDRLIVEHVVRRLRGGI
ncbi:MAG: hypothetical protein ABSG31_01175 [Tepidisphaeraceae bacterium]|jgi:hypothetical protein